MGELLTAKETAKLLGIAHETLSRWRAKGDGPRWKQEGRYIRYRRADVQAWLMGQSKYTKQT
ncbi:helix-turn-helix domain-containing protein [Ruegeria sp. HKCCD6228]|nr:helix-turn-helix domain-containing protein [Ruegeria sp. HKCCD6228]